MQVDSVVKVPWCAVFGDHIIVFGEINEIERVSVECSSLNERDYVNSILIVLSGIDLPAQLSCPSNERNHIPTA